MSRLMATGSVLAIVLAIATTSSEAAARHEIEGWFAVLDVALTDPSAELDYAHQSNYTTSPVENQLRSIDEGSDIAFRAGAGFGFGHGRGTMRVTFWGLDTDDDETKRLHGFVDPLVFGSGYYTPFYYLDDAHTEAASDLKAVTVDLDYLRTITANERFRVNWLLGLRFASYEETLDFTGGDAFVILEEERAIDTDAVGPRFGVEAEFDFGRVFGLQGTLSMSLLRGKNDGVSTFVARDATTSSLLVSERAVGEDGNHRGRIVDMGIQAIWRLSRVDVLLGFETSDWNGLVDNPLPRDPLASERDGVAFNSVHLGLRWRFGAQPASP